MKKKPDRIIISVGNKKILVTPIPQTEVAKANTRIQKKIDKVYDPRKQKRIRALATMTASKIILNV